MNNTYWLKFDKEKEQEKRRNSMKNSDFGAYCNYLRAPNDFQVKNFDNNTTYDVYYRSSKRCRCSCDDFQCRCKYLGIKCKHILYVEEVYIPYLNGEKVIEED